MESSPNPHNHTTLPILQNMEVEALENLNFNPDLIFTMK
jgi:hypothetical protein